MTLREFLLHRWITERPAFQRVLYALPLAQFAYSPHERSPSACANRLDIGAGSQSLQRTHRRGAKQLGTRSPPPVDSVAIVSTFERHTADLGERIGRLDETAWQTNARFLVQGNLAWEAPLGDLLWHMFFDSIHHRGQLSTYIRPMGGKVPSIYGPSGDNAGT